MVQAIRVLMVEDNRATCALLRAFFEQAEGLELCGEAHDGVEGLELVRAQRPDLVLLDLIMPRLDGMGFLSALRAEKPVKTPKVLVLSGVGSDEYVQRTIELGASYYLMKPVRLDELAARMNDLFPAGEAGPDSRAAWLLLRLGADKGCLGFSFACRGAELLGMLGEGALLKEVYLRLAEEFGTSYACVEKNLRTSIRQIHAAGTDLYRESLGFADAEKPPNNGGFLRAMVRVLARSEEG